MKKYIFRGIIYGFIGFNIFFPHPGIALQAPPIHSVTVFSRPFMIDRPYLSMIGPSSIEKLPLSEGKKPELLWLTGFKVEVLDPKTHTPMPMEFFCHHTLQFADADILMRNPALGQWTREDPKLASLVQGITEVQLPDGFGVPVLSNENLISNSMVINPHPHIKPFYIQVKATYSFLKDKELAFPLKPLLRRAIFLRVPLALAGEKGPDDAECCWLPKSARPVSTTRWNIRKDWKGDLTSYHWFVPPGRHLYSYILGRGLRGIPYDTTIHYIEIHLHPFGTYCALVDLTTGKTLFKGMANKYTNLNAIAHIDHYSTAAGIPIYTTHQYEIIAEYNNTTKHDIDAMGIVYFYYLSKEFNKTALNLN